MKSVVDDLVITCDEIEDAPKSVVILVMEEIIGLLLCSVSSHIFTAVGGHGR